MDEVKLARKNIQNPWMNVTSQTIQSWMSKCWKRLAQRRVKDHPAYGQRISQAVSQIYGLRKQTENSIHRQVTLVKYKEWKNVEHKKSYPNMDKLNAFISGRTTLKTIGYNMDNVNKRNSFIQKK